MKNKLAKPDIALMSFAISVSKKAAVVATIKYGRVMLSNGDIDVELQFESQLDEFQIMLVPEKNPFWKFSIPLSKLLKVEEIEAVLKTLALREEKVLRMRYGLDDGKTHTLEEVGKEFGVTRERIRQIEFKAIKRLKQTPRRNRLSQFK